MGGETNLLPLHGVAVEVKNVVAEGHLDLRLELLGRLRRRRHPHGGGGGGGSPPGGLLLLWPAACAEAASSLRLLSSRYSAPAPAPAPGSPSPFSGGFCDEVVRCSASVRERVRTPSSAPPTSITATSPDTFPFRMYFPMAKARAAGGREENRGNNGGRGVEAGNGARLRGRLLRWYLARGGRR